MKSSAVISPCGAYRYRLDRHLSNAGLVGLFIMVNPSIADAEDDDPTIRKCLGFASRNSIGHLIVGNKFAFRSTAIEGLRTVVEPVGPDNDCYLQQMLAEADICIAAWGTMSKLPEFLRGRWKSVVRHADMAGKPLYCIGTNADRHPKHPLMTSYSVPISEWTVPWLPNRAAPIPKLITIPDSAVITQIAPVIDDGDDP